MFEKGPVFILCIDGGGSRGVIPTSVRHYLERDGNLSIRDEFDFFAGVSTRAFVAAYLAKDAGTLEVLALDEYSAAGMTKHYFDKSIWDKLLGRF